MGLQFGTGGRPYRLGRRVLIGGVATAAIAAVVGTSTAQSNSLDHTGTGLDQGGVTKSDPYWNMGTDSVRVGINGHQVGERIDGSEAPTVDVQTTISFSNQNGHLQANVEANNAGHYRNAPTSNGLFVEVNGERIELDGQQRSRVEVSQDSNYYGQDVTVATVGDLGAVAGESTFTVVFGQHLDGGDVTSVPYSFVESGANYIVAANTPGQEIATTALLAQGRAQDISGTGGDYGLGG